MSRVLVVSTSSKTRGGISAVLNLLKSQPFWMDNNCVWIATHRDGNNIRKLFVLFCGFLKYILLLPFFDVVYIHFSVTTSAKRKFVFFKLARLFRKKIMIHLHCGNQLKDIWSPIYEDMFLHSDAAFVLSESIKEQVEEFLNHNKTVHVLYNPCMDVENDYSKKKNQVLFAGTLIKGKGFYDLIRAFKDVVSKHPDWRLAIAGNGEVEQGKKLAQELGIDNNVDFLGWIVGNSKDKAFRESSIFCLPSYAEGFPMAILDAWAYGLPVVTTPVGGIPNLAVDKENALFIQPGDYKALFEKLCVLIENDKIWKKLSRNAYIISHEKLSINTFTKELENVIASIY